MNREDVIRIAKESGAWDFFEIDEGNQGDMIALVELVRAIRSATKEEDAALCDKQEEISNASAKSAKYNGLQGMYEQCATTAKWCAIAIRASK